MPMNRPGHQRGVNLVEVLVTIAITSIGLLGLNALQLQANRSTQDSGNRSQAVWMLEDMANRIRANNIALPAYDTGGNPVSCANAPSSVCASYHTGNARVNANAACNNNDLAQWDLWEVACGVGANVNSSAVTRSHSVDFIANPELTVDVNAANQVTLTLSWDVRSGGVDSDNNTVYASGSANIDARRAILTSVIQP